MKQIYQFFILLISLLLLMGCETTEKSPNVKDEPVPSSGNESYQEAVQSFQKITIDQLEEKLDDKEPMMIYVGRETCPKCVEMAPLWANTVDQEDILMYYFDTDEHRDQEKAKDFYEGYKLSTIPVILVLNVPNERILSSDEQDWQGWINDAWKEIEETRAR